MNLKIDKGQFIDDKGRSVLLRGVNLGGSTKVPYSPNGATHIKTDFSNHKDVSFVGRPFPLDEADEHLSRLKKWGFNCLRFLITWEGIEHKGPGQYDNDYLNYLKKVLEKTSEYDFYCFIDPHQDVWSRMTGGDGAPGWTFEKIGLDFAKFDETDAALLMQTRYPDEFPKMVWSSNYYRFAALTMFTLFFGGNIVAPGFTIGKQTIQDYLQERYFNSMKEIAKICKKIPNVIGYDIFNEPNKGFIGLTDLRERFGFAQGLRFNGFETMATGSGCTMEIPIIEFKGVRMKKAGHKIVNPKKVSCWLPNAKDIWRELGIWDLNKNNQPELKLPYYFSKVEKTDFFWDYLRPFINNFSKEMRSIHPNSIIFIETDPFEIMTDKKKSQVSKKQWTNNDAKNIVNASHWYDGFTLYLQRFIRHFNYNTQSLKPLFFYKNIRNDFIAQLAKIKEFSKLIGNCPTLIGEFGIPFNLNNKRSFRTNDFSKHVEALTLHHECMDANLLNYTLWNYTADNCNDWGDMWNLEDLSIFSRDQQENPSDINSGGRAIEGFCRPYSQRTSGKIISMNFDRKKGIFKMKYEKNSKKLDPTIIYVPEIQFNNGYDVSLCCGTYEKDEKNQFLLVSNDIGIHKIEIRRM